MKIALFPGSFNPFTIGHHDIVQRALRLFDKVVIGIGRNTSKAGAADYEQRRQAIAALFVNEPRVEVSVFDGLTVDFAQRIGAQFVVRGVRSLGDFEYELEMADANYLLGKIETVVLFADEGKRAVSSSLVRELQAFGKDVSQYLPQQPLK